MRYPKNVAGAGSWTRLERFLILGSETGTYCVAGNPLTLESAGAARECLKADGLRVVESLIQLAAGGRAAKHEPALFVLALAASPKFANSKTNVAALEALPQIARTGAELLTFAGYVENARGWGRGLRTAVARWYLDKSAAELACEMLQASHRDLLRLSHPKAKTPAQNALFQWAVDGELGHLATPQILDGDLRQVYAFENAKKAQSEYEIVRLIEECRMTHDMIPSQWKDSAQVWESLLDTMSYQDLVANLAKLTAVGCLKPQSAAAALVVARLIDRKRVSNSRIHPVMLLSAFGAPMANVAKALEDAFYLAFGNVEPTGQRVYFALDGTATAAALMAMLFVRTSVTCTVAVFRDRLYPVKLQASDRLETVVEKIGQAAGTPDLAVAIDDAIHRKLKVDAFVMLTREPQPYPDIERYRQASGIAAKLVVMSETVSEMEDPLCLGVAGFDDTVPNVVLNFIRAPLSSG